MSLRDTWGSTVLWGHQLQRKSRLFWVPMLLATPLPPGAGGTISAADAVTGASTGPAGRMLAEMPVSHAGGPWEAGTAQVLSSSQPPIEEDLNCISSVWLHGSHLRNVPSSGSPLPLSCCPLNKCIKLLKEILDERVIHFPCDDRLIFSAEEMLSYSCLTLFWGFSESMLTSAVFCSLLKLERGFATEKTVLPLGASSSATPLYTAAASSSSLALR